jgi:hypothetical protein
LLPVLTLSKHLTSYPIVDDGIHTFKSNQYGQKSIEIGDSVYRTLASRLNFLLARPYEYVAPYVERADHLGAQTLERVDEQFPAVKKPTAELYNDTKALILLPLHKGLEGKDHVLNVYANEYKKAGEDKSLITSGKAAIAAALIVTGDSINWVSSWLKAQKADKAEALNEKVNQ